MINYYILLELHNFAAMEDVKAAHRRLSKQYHPDLNQGNRAAEEKFKIVQHAYEQLKDPVRKRNYDDILRANIYRQYYNTTSSTNTGNSTYSRPQPAAAEPPPPSPKQVKRDLYLKLAVAAGIVVIIVLGVIFGKEDNLASRLKAGNPSGIIIQSDMNTTDLGFQANDTNDDVRNIIGEPDTKVYGQGGLEIWVYSKYTVFFQNGRVVGCIRTAKQQLR
ncbi:DnaJ domain-containing protein [Chitinophaga jiangningensis]|uniref:DnaJ domain-containing protein n=1 Tax=Chitinophaga jiangningensis TaxID=1419482 RepID=A0A1M7CG45_9BACT|nr:J domain-containing protein [Chitinophaga jiangningensis]SHL66136.1 DnaJ domain-containing protein [Chitinophaga jiangningensis]